MRRLARMGLVGVAAAAAACGGDARKTAPDTAALVEDTTHVNLDTLAAAIPPAIPDTFTPPPRTRRSRPVRADIPPAPPALNDAVQRERNVSRFCYEEFGQKRDPKLTGGVAVVVTVDGSGITDAHVVDDTWSSDAGKAVNDCLDERVKVAWRLAPRAVRPGKYVVQLAFRPS